jgi:hypothetical protein
MNRPWIVVANAARARLCGYDPLDCLLAEMADFVHASGRQIGGECAYLAWNAPQGRAVALDVARQPGAYGQEALPCEPAI